MSCDTRDSYVYPAGSRMDLVQFNPPQAVLTGFDRELPEPDPPMTTTARVSSRAGEPRR